MKVPRVADFDPDAVVKPLASPLDDLPRIEKPPSRALVPEAGDSRQQDEQGGVEKSVVQRDGVPPADESRSDQDGSRPVPLVPHEPLVRDVRPVPLVPPKKRPIKQRQPFDIYYDQMETLRALALEERKQGGVGSMSAMVRQALDEYFARRRGQKPQK